MVPMTPSVYSQELNTRYLRVVSDVVQVYVIGYRSSPACDKKFSHILVDVTVLFNYTLPSKQKNAKMKNKSV